MHENKTNYWYIVYTFQKPQQITVGSIFLTSDHDWFSIRQSREFISKEYASGQPVIIKNWMKLTKEQFEDGICNDKE